MKRIFIDGSAGTTGLRIRERLSGMDGLELVALPEELRKDPSARRDAINAADVAFLCLPDAAAKEAVAMVENPATVVIDTSTAHRTSEGWEYGFPELEGRRGRIASAKRIANPGCHASGFIALVEPLVRDGIVSAGAELSAFSLTGYSGGGKKMIAEYEGGTESVSLSGGRQYALGQSHKHLPEMVKVCGLARPPCFSPVVVPHYSGMEVTVFLHGADLEAVRDCYRRRYAGGGLVKFSEDMSEAGMISSAMLTGRDDMLVGAYGSEGRVVLVSCFDNLGKGASGAAIQNMNVALGRDELAGLRVG